MSRTLLQLLYCRRWNSIRTEIDKCKSVDIQAVRSSCISFNFIFLLPNVVEMPSLLMHCFSLFLLSLSAIPAKSRFCRHQSMYCFLWRSVCLFKHVSKTSSLIRFFQSASFASLSTSRLFLSSRRRLNRD